MKSVEGHLEILDGRFGFLRSVERNFQPNPADTFVPANLIQKFNLREGILIEGVGIRGDRKKKNLKLTEIEKINQITLKEFSKIKSLQSEVSISPSEKLKLAQGPDDIMGKALDMIVPIGKGQRGLIISPPKSGKTTILKHMANSLITNHPEVVAFVLLVDERPEEVTDFRRGLKYAHVLSSSSDQSVSQHLRITKLTVNAAIRLAETGRDAVVFIDSLTRMSRAFNSESKSHGRTLSGGLGANAMQMPRRIFGAARNIDNGGSLTIIATILIDTGSKMDDIIFQEFKGTGNMDLMLSRKCAEQRLWPAINIIQSGTRKEHLLLNDLEFQEMVKLRRKLSKKDEIAALSAFIEYLGK
ncbi:MAG: transcription termination factor Rho [Desulfobacteraceae bacterium 4572_87]|nr:MAG: transcription termination factor Rho [Desulfobacteraceae bacterium 4572_87]